MSTQMTYRDHIKPGHYLVFGDNCRTIYQITPWVWHNLVMLASWHGCNLGNEPITLQGESALRFADALLDAMDDIPDHDALADKREMVECPDGGIRLGLPFDVTINPIEWFSWDGGQEWLRGFVLLLYRYRGFRVDKLAANESEAPE